MLMGWLLLVGGETLGVAALWHRSDGSGLSASLPAEAAMAQRSRFLQEIIFYSFG